MLKKFQQKMKFPWGRAQVPKLKRHLPQGTMYFPK